ncbi:MAG: riboflavin synthase [Candidatus Dadabacteria bacterium]|nr:MAG: riboflavin synthase [Candidatus Dadabacteria bacterium]
MFTGIVQDVGTVREISTVPGGKRLRIATGLDTADFELGESVAVDGVCLTVTEIAPGRFSADASPETLGRSTLSALRPGRRVNLERALRLTDRLGGHLVLGHVDATGRVLGIRTEGAFRVVRFEAPPEVARYLVEKGSVAVDGVSLTVYEVSAGQFSVAVIPHTWDATALADRAPGDPVNLEADILAKYVERLLGGRTADGGVTWDLLARSGFLK